MSPKVLRPIVHKDAYTRAIEAPVLAWMWEAVFAPLFVLLDNAGVPIDPKYQAIRFDEEGRENSHRSMELFDDALGGLGLERNELPQIAPEAQGALINFLQARGVTFEETELRPGQIKPCQKGFYREAVEKAKQFIGEPARALLVSRDGYLLDGHHRWAAHLFYAPETKLRVFMFSARVREMIRLLHEFPSSTRENAAATSAVRAALESGAIHYADGVFSGKFSAAISRELRLFGATWHASTKTFRLPQASLPVSINAAVVDSINKARHLHEDVISTLAAMEGNIIAAPMGMGVALSQAVDRVVIDAGRQFIASVATEGIRIPAEFTPAMRKQFAAELTNNMELSVKNFSVDMVKELRSLAEQNGFAGARTDKLAAIIESRFGVSKRKAEFLADQETGLLMAKYRQARYQDIGVQEYIWSTSHDVRVRPDHRLLDGRRFSYASPPVVDRATGRRCNPGEDFRCRCVPRPIVNLQAA